MTINKDKKNLITRLRWHWDWDWRSGRSCFVCNDCLDLSRARPRRPCCANSIWAALFRASAAVASLRAWCVRWQSSSARSHSPACTVFRPSRSPLRTAAVAVVVVALSLRRLAFYDSPRLDSPHRCRRQQAPSDVDFAVHCASNTDWICAQVRFGRLLAVSRQSNLVLTCFGLPFN